MYGAAFAYRKSKHTAVLDVRGLSERVMSVDLSHRGLKLKVVCAYAPTEAKATVASRNEFYSDLAD